MAHTSNTQVPSQDARISSISSLITPEELAAEYPLSEELRANIRDYRREVENILDGKDDRLIAVVGPCSIHDTAAGLEYADRLKQLSESVKDVFFVVMRTYFEKPRTTVGWKGLILDPDLDGSYDIGKGLEKARSLLISITEKGLPVGCEVLDPIIPQYIDELMTWSSIGARTSESQTHRNLASGLSVPIGFKNSTSGELSSAINAIKSASVPASFIGINKQGQSVVLRTTGNAYGHLILRGGDQGPNYYEDDVERARKKLQEAGLPANIVVDCSHGNSRKDFRRQKRVLRNVIDQYIWGEKAIKGFMLESNLFEGCQSIPEDLSALSYGVSITDACIGWEETERILMHAAELIRKGRSGSEDIL